ncbi:MAG TPA: hypothetical protein VFH04_00695, partial [Nitrososphaeraceae archaeon]|nr:hypothetical protein [Nitrososphaeraceae archaeon]
MKDCKTLALITLSLFISSIVCNLGYSYSQLYNPQGVKILSPTRGQVVPVSIHNLTVEGVSTDNSTNDCEVSLILNGITPYIATAAKGKNGTEDFSVWEHTFDSNFDLKLGENKVTAKLLCSNDDGSQISKYHSVNFTGRADLTSGSPTRQELITHAVRENSSLASSYEGVENKSVISKSGHATKALSNEQIGKHITPNSGVVPAQQPQFPSSSPYSVEETIKSNPANLSSTGNITSGPVSIPPQQPQSPSSSPYSVEETIKSNPANLSSTSNITSGPVSIPPQELRSSSPFASPGNQSHTQKDHVPPEIDQQPEENHLTGDDTPLIFPTPSPQVKSGTDQNRPIPYTSQGGSMPVISVDNNNSKVSEGSIVLFNGTQSYSSGGPIVSHTWQPLSSQSIDILSDLHTPILKFRAPSVSHDTPLQFEFTISDSRGNSETEMVQVLVEDIVSTDLGAKNQSGVQIPSSSVSAIQDVPSKVRIPGTSEAESSHFLDERNNILRHPENQTSGTIIRNPPAEGKIKSGQDYPKAMAGVDQIMNEGTDVTLEGSSNNANQSQHLTYKWVQTGGDIKVEFGGSDSKQISFQAPEVDADTVLTFRFLVFNETG